MVAAVTAGPHKPIKGAPTKATKYGLIVYHCAGKDAYGRPCAKYAYDHPVLHISKLPTR